MREGDEGGRETGSEWKESEKEKALMDGKQERSPLGPRLFLSAFHFKCGYRPWCQQAFPLVDPVLMSHRKFSPPDPLSTSMSSRVTFN